MPNFSNLKKLSCCGREINTAELWILKDFKGFTKRKLLVGRCLKCGDLACLQIMTNVKSGITYYNLYNRIEAIKTIYKEKKRMLQAFPDVSSNSLYGWVYGHNVQIKNKKGEVTQIRQYASDFGGNKSLIKKIVCK